MAEILFLVEEAPEGGFTARALGFSIYTEADTWEELKTAVQDAVQCHFEEIQKPRVIRLHYLREEVLAVRGSQVGLVALSLQKSWSDMVTISPGKQAVI